MVGTDLGLSCMPSVSVTCQGQLILVDFHPRRRILLVSAGRTRARLCQSRPHAKRIHSASAATTLQTHGA